MIRSDRTPAPFLAAAIQFEPTLFDTAGNIAKLLALTGEAAANGAKLIVHPEMATTGYCWESRAEIAPHVEPIPGPTTDAFGALAARHNCHIVVAVAEVAPATGIYYNSAALIGPGGVIGVYRKTHSYISEPKWAKDGDLGLPTFDTPLGRIAITICMDAVFPETARIPALAGADVICFPTNWLAEKCPSSQWMARALDNGVYFVAANRYGLERGVQFSGGSCIIDPDGSIQSMRDNGDGIVYGEVDPARARDKRWPIHDFGDRFTDRRPGAYGSITLSTYRWQDRDFHGLYGINPIPDGRKSRVVACQFAPIPGDAERNLDVIESVARENRGADLIVFPELAVTGRIDSVSAARSAASVEESVLQRLATISRATGVHLVAGMVDAGGDHLYNAAALAGPDGVIGIYRKIHLTESDRTWASASDALRTFNIPAGRIGILIGYDATFPEAATCLALDGADLIACPSLMAGPDVVALGPTTVPLKDPVENGRVEAHFHLWRERARETNTMVVFANGSAPEMGWSGIFGASIEDDHTERVLLAGNGEGTISFELDTTNLPTRYKTNPVRAKDTLAMRMPIWYDDLQKPWQPAVRSPAPELLVTAGGDD